MEIFKCGKDTCKVCKPIRMPSTSFQSLMKRPRLIPLPTIDSREGLKHEGMVKYKGYEELKNVMTYPNDRPSFLTGGQHPIPPDVIKADSELGKLIPSHISIRSKNKNLWHVNNVRSTVECAACRKPRLVYSWPAKAGEDMDMRVVDLMSVMAEPGYDYICGDFLFGMEECHFPLPPGVDNFHVRQSIHCSHPIQTQYYLSRKKLPPICINCGNPDFIVPIDEGMRFTDHVKPYPICRGCFDEGSEKEHHGQTLWGRQGISTSVAAKIDSNSKQTEESKDSASKADKDMKEATSLNEQKLANLKKRQRGSKAAANKLSKPGSDKNEAKALGLSGGDSGEEPTAKKMKTIEEIDSETSIKKDFASMFAQASTSKSHNSKKKQPKKTQKEKKAERNIVRLGMTMYLKNSEALFLSCRIPVRVYNDFEILNVEPNGNCCYLAAQQFLFETKRQPAMSITDFRRMVRDHLVDLKPILQNEDRNSLFTRMGGESTYSDIIAKAFVDGKDFTSGCSEDLWGTMAELAPTFILKYNISVVVYSPAMNSKYWFDESTNRIEQLHGNEVPPPSILTCHNTLSVIFKGSHYYLIRLRKWESDS